MNENIAFVEVKQTTDKERGVFAAKSFEKGEIIEECPIILMNTDDHKLCEETILDYYIFRWGYPPDDSFAVVLGYGSLYNHSYTPNAVYERDYVRNLMLFRAHKNIEMGDEITINYNGDPENKDPIDWLADKL